MIKIFTTLILLSLFSGYTYFVYTDGTSIPENTQTITSEAQKGKLLYQKLNCTSCHQLYGLGGYLGPDLTNTMSENEKGEQFTKAIMKSGTKRMPDFKLTTNEIDQLLAYLKYVNQTTVQHYDQ